MRHSLSRQALEWRVTKGLCHFRIDGFGCWKGIAGAGESGSLRWNASRKLADLSNTGDQPVLAQLSGRVTAGIFPGATFQYAQLQDCGSFVTTASGGRTALFERDTGEVNFIEQAPAAYSEGHRSETAGAQRRWVPLSFSWEKDDRVQVRGVSGPVQVTAGAERTIQFNQDQMHVQYAKSGDLTFRALKGNFEVKPDFVEEFSFEVPETGALVLNLDRRRWVLSARAAEDSGVVIRSIASGETYMYLAGEAKITVHPGQRTFFPEGTAAWIFFEGAGGESDFAIGPQPGLVISPDRFDSSRIPQQPVSVIE